MDQPLQIKDGVVQLVNSFPKTEFEPIPLIEPLVDITESIASQMSIDSIVS